MRQGVICREGWEGLTHPFVVFDPAVLQNYGRFRPTLLHCSTLQCYSIMGGVRSTLLHCSTLCCNSIMNSSCMHVLHTRPPTFFGKITHCHANTNLQRTKLDIEKSYVT